jgi:tellurite resistance protein TerC
MNEVVERVFPLTAAPDAPQASRTGQGGSALAPASARGANTDAPAPPAPPAPPGGPDGGGPKQPWHKRPAVQILLSVAAAAAFNLGLYLHSGAQAAQEFLSTYLIEWTMSLDNIVVLSTAILAAPPASRGKVTRWALLGSIAARMVMVTAGVGLVAAHAALFYAFGAFLLATAVKMLKPEWDLIGLVLKPFGKLFKRRGSAGAKPAVRLSPTVKVVLAIVGINVVFALDSVPAALAISKNAFVIIAANAFSLVGLGAVASFLDDLEKRFALLPKGVAAVLVFVGGKMIVEPLLGVSLGALASTAVIVSLLGGSALLSLLRARR